MSYLHINGYPVPVAHGSSLTYQEVAAMRDYSFNGRYQFARSALAPGWQFVTAPMARDEAIALAGMINHEGDGWRWDLPSGTTPNGVHYVVNELDAEAYSDARRVQQSSEAKATVVSAYGADGSRVYDWNGNAYAPFSGCQGSLIVDDGTTNKATANQFSPTNATGFSDMFSRATITFTTDESWAGAGSIDVSLPGTGAAEGVKMSGASGFTDAVFSCFIKPGKALTDAGATFRVTIYDTTDSVYLNVATDYAPTDPDGWFRVFHTGSPALSTNTLELRIYINNNPTAGAFQVAGVQYEEDPGDGYPSAPVDPGADPWGSGNGVRPTGGLDYDQWMYDFDKGFTVSAWINLQYTGSTGSRVFFRNSNTSTFTQMYISSGDSIVFDVRADAGSALQQTQTGFTTLGWHHVVGTYSARDRAASLYVDGALVGTDSSWNGARKFIDPSKFGIDFAIGSIGNPGFDAKIPIGPIQVYPFAMPAQMVTGLYNSATDDVPVPGVMPLAVHGDMFAAGQTHQYCYGQVESIDTVPHTPDSTAQWEDGACTVKFSLFADRGR